MGEVLSQQEIDALLNALTSGELAVEDVREQPEEDKIKLYDFKNPKKIAQEQIRTLRIIYDNVARTLSTLLSTSLRISVNLNVATVEQLAYAEFIRSLPNPTVLGIYTLEPLEGYALVEMNTRLAFALLDRMLGGPGKVPALDRPLTEIEQSLFKKQFFQRFMASQEEAWSKVRSLRPALEQMESNPQVVQIVSPNEIVALITLGAEIGEERGFINIGIPYLMLEPVMPRLTTRFWYSNLTRLTRSREDQTIVQERLRRAKLDVSVVLGSAEIKVRELLELRVGDVIQLDTKIDQPASVNVANRAKFAARPGVVGKHLAVQIIDYLEGEL